MANNGRTRADAGWVSGYAPTPGEWSDLERKIFRGVNGDRGGAYAPLDPTTILGSGLVVSGPTRLTAGGGIIGLGSNFVIRDGAWPLLKSSHVAAHRTIVQVLHDYQTPPTVGTGAGMVDSISWMWVRHASLAGIASVALSSRKTYAATVDTPEFYASLRVHDGAALSSIDITFTVLSSRDRPPIATPKFRVLRVPKDAQANAPLPLKSTPDGTGFVSPPIPASGAAWFNAGAAQVFTYACDQNNVIDVANYSYVLHVVEELGVKKVDDPFDAVLCIERKSEVNYLSAVGGSVPSAVTTLTDAGVADGNIGANAGDRVLLTNGSFGHVNCGIWVQGAPWKRAVDLTSPSDFTPGFCVPVRYGSINSGTWWQCQYPTSSQKIGTDPSTGFVSALTPIAFAPPVARGNLYSSVVSTFALADLRFQ